MTLEDLLKMPLHTRLKSEDQTLIILRVASGWIYTLPISGIFVAVFVPLPPADKK